jgi:2-dehydropantoate 2-reductase
MSRYLVVGAGALGALLAAQLQQAGISTVLVARGANLAAIRSTGVTIHRPDGTDVIPVAVVGSPGELVLTRDDVIVLATKTQDAEPAVVDWAWRPLADGGIAAELPIVTLHNGLAAEDIALRRFVRVHGATMWIAASHLTPGEVVSPSWPVVGIVWIGSLGAATASESAAIAADFHSAGYLAHPVDDIAQVKAHKLLGNLSNALDLFDGEREHLDHARIAILDEATAVYAAAGIVARDPSVGRDVSFSTLDLRPVPGQLTGKRSTWQSFARGTSSEVDYLNGEIVLLGRRHGVATPVNERVQQVLGALAATGGGAEPRDISELLDPAAAGLKP